MTAIRDRDVSTADDRASELPSGSGKIPGITFDDVTVSYHGGIVVLDSFSLQVEAGEVIALLGPSGSGKTTALRSVAGFVHPTRGRILLGERDVTDVPPYARGVGMVVQQYALFPHMKVADNVAFGLRAQKADRKTIPVRVRAALDMVGMAKYADRYPRALSGGQQQRVAIARALAIQPKVLLLDEPLSALDAQLRSGMLAEIARLHRELPDVTILYVTHDQVEALTLADRIAVMNEAKLIEVGPARRLYDRPGHEFTAGFVGNANLLRVTVAAGRGVDGVARASFGEQQLTVSVGQEFEAAQAQEAVVCVRPHCLSVAPEAGCSNKLHGLVTEVQWRGDTHRLYVEVAGQSLKVDCSGVRTPPRIGDSVELHFRPSDAILVQGGSG